MAFSHRPKETFPLILNFGATELALPVARVWRRFAAQRDLARQWILHWSEHTATALIPLVFTKSSDNSEAALLALRLLYEQGHGELLQTVANRWQRTDVWPATEQLLKQSPIEIYPTRIPKAPDFWQPAMWSRPRLITNNQPVTDDALEIIGEMLRFTQWRTFLLWAGTTENVLPATNAGRFCTGSLYRVATSWRPRKRQLGISGVKSLR